MISGFMSSDTQPPNHEGTQRGADFYDLLAWLEVNKAKVAVAVVILIGIGFAVAAMRYLKDQKEAAASAELLALKPALAPQTNVPPAQPSAFLKVAEQYPGTSAGERAEVFAATSFFTDGKYADAEREFSRFVKEHPESPWAAEAAYGAATALEAQNKLPEAQSAYQNVAAAYASSSIAEDAKLGLARVYELRKQPDQALRIYNDLLAPRPGSQPGEMGSQAAFQRKEALLRENPNLSTNAPPPVQVSAPAIAPPPQTNQAVMTNAANPARLSAPATATSAPAASKPAVK
jgi:TolA-binding protein